MVRCKCDYPEDYIFFDMPTVEYCDTYDNYYCEACNMWLEEACSCSDEECPYAGHDRPLTPKDYYLKHRPVEWAMNYVFGVLYGNRKRESFITLDDVRRFIRYRWKLDKEAYDSTAETIMEDVTNPIKGWMFDNPLINLTVYETLFELVEKHFDPEWDSWIFSHLEDKISLLKNSLQVTGEKV